MSLGNILLCVNLIVMRAFDGNPLIAPVSIGLVLLAAIAGVGLLTESRRIHAVLAVAALTV